MIDCFIIKGQAMLFNIDPIIETVIKSENGVSLKNIREETSAD